MIKFIIVEIMSFLCGVGVFHIFNPEGFAQTVVLGVITGILVGASSLCIIYGEDK